MVMITESSVLKGLVLLLAVHLLTGCTAHTLNSYLEDEPTRLEKHFGESVRQMKTVQIYSPDQANKQHAGQWLEGWEAEALLNNSAAPTD